MSKNNFAGADDIYLTRKYICVRRVSSKKDSNGGYSLCDSRRYYPKTKENFSKVRSILGYIPETRKK